ncbi:DUF3016 domain-containing protein [Ensifer sp. ENS07]|uniref:DUF3016 domain-containing protein n=1 Tax=Ensifer sp. ENS07 TaxID=2769274 RepID=UPI0017874A9C|nr:DUF3016 domain-containing protein [Ensifer sp. ENS07]MBD9638950.1 DUF3016 domain-containing protein [Ensifer sp. ENS07]
MRFATRFAFAVTVALLLGSTAYASVSVDFVHPEKFRDPDFRSFSERNRLISEFRGYFETLAGRYLKKGQALRIDVLDVRLAGQYEPWRPYFDDVRILRDSTPPRFKLRYKLTEGGRVLAQGEEVVSDLNYLWTSSARTAMERHPYEKEMLRDWFRKRLVKLQPARH